MGFAEGDPEFEDGRIFEPGHHPENHLDFGVLFGGVDFGIVSGEFGVILGFDYQAADAELGGAIGGGVLLGEFEESALELMEVVLAHAFDDGGEQDIGFAEQVTEHVFGDGGEAGAELGGQRFVNHYDLSVGEFLLELC